MEKGIAKHFALFWVRGNVAIAICGVEACVLHFSLVTKLGVRFPFVPPGRFASNSLRCTNIAWRVGCCFSIVRVCGVEPWDPARKVLGVHQWNIEFYSFGLCSSAQSGFSVRHVCVVELFSLCKCVALHCDFWIWESKQKSVAPGFLGSWYWFRSWLGGSVASDFSKSTWHVSSCILRFASCMNSRFLFGLRFHGPICKVLWCICSGSKYSTLYQPTSLVSLCFSFR